MKLLAFSQYSVLRALLVLALSASSAAPFAEEELSVEQRLERVERMLDSKTLIEMNMRLGQIQQEMAQMRGQIELLEHDFGDVKNRQKEIYMDLDRRIGQMQAPAAPAPIPGAAPVPAAPIPSGVSGGSSPPPPPPVVSPAPSAPQSDVQNIEQQLGEQEAYDQSFALLKAKDFQRAIGSFQSFLASYPQSNLAPNAQYWLAECFYVLRQFDSALPEFQKVVSLYPGDSKVPDAQLKIGYIHYEYGQWDQVRAVLTDLKNQHPASTAARLADLRLGQMKQEGH